MAGRPRSAEPGLLAGACLRIIDRYQRSKGAAVFDKSCRFSPTCCAFMHEAFATRAFPVAFLMSAGRLVRCNPLARRGTRDPVVAAAHLRPRPNVVRTVAALAMVGGLVVLLASSSQAQTVEGGCSALINGRQVTTMTHGAPLIVNEGESVSVVGTIPGNLIAQAQSVRSNTHISITIVEPIFDAGGTEDHLATGAQWGGTVNVDRYLNLGGGLYRVEANAQFAAAGAPAGGCVATAYIKLIGGPLLAVAAGGVATLGAVGSVFAPGTAKNNLTVADLGASLDADIKRSIPGIDPSSPAPPPETETIFDSETSFFGMPCGPVLLLGALAAFGVFGSAGGGAARGAYVPGQVLLSKRVWRRGHPIVGFISGLFFGLGLSVFLQQRGIWTLNVRTAIVLPIALGLIAGVRGWYGRAYRVTVRATGAGRAPAPAAGWAPTHVVAGDGLPAWATPDPSGQVIGSLAARTELRVVERVADWARVDGENGWTGWVNAQGLRGI
jgi:putative component of membrane protein insertase Oxa1/YidC/SpoIIIJ protein YidD